MAGLLYIVSTPIGNLEDITYRAVRILKEVSVITAEDTRHSATLCSHYAIGTPMISYHDHNKEQRTPELIGRLLDGEDVAVISDAGTPGVSDPAFYLVREAVRNGITVVPVPGASAMLAALVASGLPTDRFSFEGFLPNKGGKRRTLLEKLVGDERTLIFYESPYRIVKALGDIAAIMPEAAIVVARELTKKFEEIQRGKAEELKEYFEQRKPKGEFVVLISQKDKRNDEKHLRPLPF